jgi:hypothetical protein
MKKFISCVCLFLTLCMFMPSALPTVQAQQNIAANPLGCTLQAILNAGSPTTATTRFFTAAATGTQTIFINGVATAVTVGKSVKICSYILDVKQPATPGDFGLIYGTGTNCGTGTTNVTPQFFGTASVNQRAQQEYSSGTWLIVPPGKDICAAVSAAVTNIRVTVLYRLE